MFYSVCGINTERQSVEALLASLTTNRRMISDMAVPTLDDDKESLKREKRRAYTAKWKKKIQKKIEILQSGGVKTIQKKLLV